MKALPPIFSNLETIAGDCHKSLEILGSIRVILGNLRKCSDHLRKSSEVFGWSSEIFGSIRVIFGNLRKYSGVFGSVRKSSGFFGWPSYIFGYLRGNLHCVTSFCTELPLFCIVLPENCISLNQSEWRNFFMYIIMSKTTLNSARVSRFLVHFFAVTARLRRKTS